MSDLPTPFGGKPISLRNNEGVANALAGSAANDPRGGAPDGSQYLNFSGKRGVYEFGPDKEDIPNDELWLVNVASFEDGWVCWKGGNTQAKRFANVFTDPPIPTPDFNEFGPFTKDGDGWYQAKAFILKSLDEDRQAYFTNNSKSGVSAIARLQSEVADRLRTNQPYWPLVMLDKEAFSAQGYKNHKPVLNIYGWLDDQAVQTLAENDDADVDDLIEASTGRVGQELDAPEGATENATPDEPNEVQTLATEDKPEPKQEKPRRGAAKTAAKGNGRQKRPAL